MTTIADPRLELRAAFSAALAELHPELDGQPDFTVEPSAKPEFGHYACNLAMQLARPLKSNPRRIAEELVEAVAPRLSGIVERLEIAGPGFINLHLDRRFLEGRLHDYLDEVTIAPVTNQKSINLEYVSANPTGPLLVVNGRAAALGSALAAVLRAVGHEVTEEYYVNDAGTQVLEFGKSVFRLNRDRYRDAGWSIPDEIYAWGDDGGYADETVQAVAERLLQLREREAREVERQDGSVDKRFTTVTLLYEITDAVKIQLDLQWKSLHRFGVNFDRHYQEHLLYAPPSGYPYQKILSNCVFPDSLALDSFPGPLLDTYRLLIERGVTYEAEGATWLRTTDHGDDKDRVIVRSNGKPTYLLADIAYHLDKWKRLNDNRERLLIDIWGPDHHGHILPTRAGLEAAGVPGAALEVLISGWVTFKQGERIVAMSKRKGNLVTLDDLIDEVGVDVARYMFLERSPESHLEFDLDLAAERSAENPAYYIQYAYTRLSSIFGKAEAEGYSLDDLTGTDPTPLFTVNDDREESAVARQGELLRQLLYYPGVVHEAAEHRAPQRLAAFLHQTAGLFHPYYKAVKVLVEDETTARARLALCLGLRNLFRHGLELLGLAAREEM